MTPGRRDLVGCGLGELDGRQQVGLEVVLDRLPVCGEDRSPSRPPNTEKQVVDPAEDPEGVADDAVAFPRSREVGSESMNLARGIGHGERPADTVAGSAHEQHASPRPSQMPAEHQAETGRATRHDHPPGLPDPAHDRRMVPSGGRWAPASTSR